MWKKNMARRRLNYSTVQPSDESMFGDRALRMQVKEFLGDFLRKEGKVTLELAVIEASLACRKPVDKIREILTNLAESHELIIITIERQREMVSLRN